MTLSGVGIWSTQLRGKDKGEVGAVAAELESLGYTSMWIPGGQAGPIFDDARALLAATQHMTVATGIMSLWTQSAAEAASGYAALATDFPGRFVLGIGASHAVLVDRDAPGRYQRPLTAMRAYLDELDHEDPPVPVSGRMLAALGPRMLALARDRSAGAHPYFVSPEHTRVARDVLGPGPILAPEQSVVLASDRATALAGAHEHIARYVATPNYMANLRRLGFTDDDFADGGSDRVADTIVAAGDETLIAARVAEHFAAGATHVCIQVAPMYAYLPGTPFPLDTWRRLAPALVGLGA